MKKQDSDQDVTAIPNDEPTMKQLMALLLETRKTDQEIQREQLKQTRRRSNAQGPDISVYNPRGQKDYPMPDLAFEVLAPWSLRPGFQHGMTWEEVELMNRVKPGEVVLELNDDSTVHCSIIATKNMTTGKIERIAFMGARDAEGGGYTTLFSRERRHLIPGMVALLHQVLDQQGTKYDDIVTMKDMTRRIALPAEHPDFLPVSIGE